LASRSSSTSATSRRSPRGLFVVCSFCLCDWLADDYFLIFFFAFVLLKKKNIFFCQHRYRKTHQSSGFSSTPSSHRHNRHRHRLFLWHTTRNLLQNGTVSTKCYGISSLHGAIDREHDRPRVCRDRHVRKHGCRNDRRPRGEDARATCNKQRWREEMRRHVDHEPQCYSCV
jgi:hypothetical protein